ncbi:MAG: hypothetical protein KKA67_10830 [Spirochaetes bacterium]|nr:hypothetical protein [Spirochaetota bacterium]MBU1080680.1 hypothetical protein [Spirochaetota bacterium]
MQRSRSLARACLAFALLLALAPGRAAFAQPGGAGPGSGGKPAGVGADTAAGEAPDDGASAGSGSGNGSAGSAGNSAEGTGRTGAPSRAAGRSDASERRAIEAGDESVAEFDRWLASSKEGASLSGAKSRIRAIAYPAISVGVPVGAFTSRIREAVAKGASPEVLARALEADAASWTWLARLAAGGAWPPARSASEFYLAVSSALRNGLGKDSVREVFEWASASRASAEKAGAALTAAAAVTAALGYPGGAVKSLALRIAESRLPVGRYGDLASLARRAAAAGISPSRFAQGLESALGRGGALSDLERDLFP